MKIKRKYKIKIKTKPMVVTPLEIREYKIGEIISVDDYHTLVYQDVYKWILPHRSYLAERRKFYWSRRNMPVGAKRKLLLALRTEEMRNKQRHAEKRCTKVEKCR